jgi:lipid-A-disaccharide synthase
VNGVLPVLRRLPTLLKRINAAAAGVAAAKPDVVVHIDAQDFNQRVARKLRRLIPAVPLVGYVSPTVWAWRPGRARKLRPLYRKLLAVLPFEPEVHRRLQGPEAVYVGHPLMERREDWARSPSDTAHSSTPPYRLLVLPGSRRSEVERLLPLFGEAVEALSHVFPGLQPVIPAVDHLRSHIENATAKWPVRPVLVKGEADKWQAFRTARAAIAASGTVTLELALAGVPTVVAYRVSRIEGEIGRRMITTPYASLPNIILGRALLPEFIERGWDGHDLAKVVAGIMADGPAREAQLAGFAEVTAHMASGIDQPSGQAAREILALTHEKGLSVERP